MHIIDKFLTKCIQLTLLTAISISLLSGCITQSFENNEPIVKNQANRDEMAATRVSLGLGYLRMGDMSQAKLNLEKAKQFSPGLVQVHTAFAHYYETVGEGTLAIESFEQALTIKADSADTLNNYGVFLCRQDKVAAAEVQFLKAIAVPSYLLVSQSYENLSSCYLQIDNFEKAEMYLNKAIFHSPNRTTTLLQMVRLQYAMGNYKESKRFLQKFERNTQRFTASSLALAYKLYWKLGQRRTAGNYANMLVKMYPQSWEGKQYLLNELEFIESDELAKKYQLTQKEKNRGLSPSQNKRVVKLSPKKSANTPYTSSVKTVTPALTANEVVVTSTNAAVTTTAMTSTPSLIADTTITAMGSGAALLTATAAVAIVTSNDTAVDSSGTVVTNAEEITPIATSKEAEKLAAVVTEIAVVAQPVSSAIEPTSTKPIPATRDVPLPEALPNIIEAQVITAETTTVDKKMADELEIVVATSTTAIIDEGAENSAKKFVDDIEMVDSQDAFHKVLPGENLYSISVKYNVKLKRLRQWNNIAEKNKIRIGDKLYVVDPQTVNNINE
ncbi:type IV pilus biogenesis/stability protein PilW [Colwellia sp. 12G3]|uniref:type IV pilus biogenesis/stability protein PilW n=1 Tax=Colwellia sp. 12G3 TaxID=2058299 RepID=UPI001E5A420C|nr:type IV pilus biogenesis/stability protein PilW [Colwellia sp. 12G3]